jgi:hypothetical protein
VGAPAFEAGQHARFRRIVSQQDANLVALEARAREKPAVASNSSLILPEVADVVTRRRECVGDAQRNVTLERRSVVKARARKRPRSPSFSASFGSPSVRRSSPSALTTSFICAKYARHPAHVRKCSSQRARSAGGYGVIQIAGHELHEFLARHTVEDPIGRSTLL